MPRGGERARACLNVEHRREIAASGETATHAHLAVRPSGALLGRRDGPSPRSCNVPASRRFLGGHRIGVRHRGLDARRIARREYRVSGLAGSACSTTGMDDGRARVGKRSAPRPTRCTIESMPTPWSPLQTRRSQHSPVGSPPAAKDCKSSFSRGGILRRCIFFG